MAALALAISVVTPGTAVAGSISYFTWAFTDNFYFLADAMFQTDGTASSTTQSGVNAHALAEGVGAADLSGGTLRALAHTRSDAGYPNGGDTETWVGFGDSFRTVTSTGAPFNWAGTTATMSVNIGGSIGSTGVSPYDNGIVAMCVLPAGGLDAFASTIRTNNYVEGDADVSVCSSWQGYNLGPGDGDFPELLTFPTSVDFTFAPGGDFDWFLIMFLQVSSNNGGEALADFSHTLQATYTGPSGSITRSASGEFPGTLPLADAGAPVPEPSSLVLLGTGLAVAWRRSRGHA